MDKKNEDHDDSYEIVFRNGALKRLQDIAKKLDIPEDNLAEVISKGMKVMQLADDNQVIVNNGGEKYILDLKKI